MAAHPGVSVNSSFLNQSSGLTTTPVGVRHRYLTRRKRTATAISRMATAQAGTSSGGGGRRSNGGGSRVGGGGGGGYCSVQPLGRTPEDEDAHHMHVDGGLSTDCDEKDGDEAETFRLNRVLSCPAGNSLLTPLADGDLRRGLSIGAAGLGPRTKFILPDTRGITMGEVHGPVHSIDTDGDAEPEAAAAAAATTASAAVAGAAAAATAAAAAVAANAQVDTANTAIVCLKPSAGDEGGAPGGTTVAAGDGAGERRARSISTDPTVLCEPVTEAARKRVKSGASFADAASVEGGGVQTAEISVGGASEEEWLTPPASPIETAADGAAVTVASPAAEESFSVGGPTAAESGRAAEGVLEATAAAAGAAARPVLSNDQWIARLLPLLESIPAGTHPEDYLHDILRQRGYSTEMAAMKETAFHRPPEPDQVAAYDKAILRAVLDEDEEMLERMRAAGRRMDACNRFGDSVLHMACRRGRASSLRFLLRATGPAGVVLSDDFGRTVLHDACWTATPRFDVASTVLDTDTRLLRTLDSRGSSPLQYVPREQWPLWCAFFESRKEVYWPPLAPGEEDVAGIIPLAVVM